jgi:Secretion system C-terminal sorting domain
MKKIYLSALALSIGTLSFGQSKVQNTIPFKTQEGFEAVKSATNFNAQDKATVLYTDDFSNASLWSMTGGSPTNWTIGVSASGAGGFPLADLLSTSGAPFALFDSDGVNAGGFQDAAISLIAPINCTGFPSISVEFENYFRPFNTTLIYVEVSNDNINWDQYQVHGSVPSNGATANPETTVVNISATAGNQATVYIRFRNTGDWDYGWAIDDLKVQTSDDNDLVANGEFYGFFGIPYTRIPVLHNQAADWSMWANNVGAVDQTNTVLTVLDNGTPVSASTPQTVAAGNNDSLFAPSFTFTPTILVPHTLTLSLASDSTDASPANNDMAFNPFEFTPNMYALDDYGQFFTPGNAGGAAPSGGFEFEAGNYFDAIVADVAYGIEVVIGSNTVANTVIDYVLYDITSGSFVEIDRSGFYTTTALDAGNAIYLSLPNTPALTAGNTYFAAVHSFTEMYYGVSGSSPGNNSPGGTTSLIFFPNMVTPTTGENFFTTQTPMVRLNVSNPLSTLDVLSETVDFSVYPNPSKGIFTLNLNADVAENVSLSVKNIVGQTVLNKTVTVSGATKEVISLENYDKGVYFLTIDNNREKKTVKLIVE